MTPREKLAINFFLFFIWIPIKYHKVVTSPLTFWIVLQQEVEVAELTENVRVHLPLCFQDEGIVAANSLNERAIAVKS